MADKKKMSVEEILAACRKDEGPSEPAAGPPAADPPAESSSPTAESGDQPASSKPKTPSKSAAGEKPGKPTDGKKAGPMSVADILAAARTGKGGGAAPEPKPTKKPTPAKAPAAKKEAPPKGAAKAKPAASGIVDTQSILASARSGKKAGPVSKQEAASRGQAPAGKQTAKPVMPERPAYVQPAPVAPAASQPQRRDVLSFLCGAFFGSFFAAGMTALGATAAIGTLGVARFMFPNTLREPPTTFRVGFPTELAPGQVETKYQAQFGVWIVRGEYDGQSLIYALSTVCTHLGCTPNWLEAEQKFKCPCHGSGFYKDGVNFEGPAPRPLERYAIRTADDGQLEVDKSRTFQEELGQWNDPASFVIPV